MERNELVDQIKSSKKYKYLSEEVIIEKVDNYTKKNPRWQEYKPKFILKEIKAMLHSAYGSFQAKGKNKLSIYLEQLRKDPHKKEIINKMLETNRSTKERLEVYNKIYSQIFRITGIPKVIVDLGCGLNPLSVSYMNLKNIDYYSYDISKYDINLIKDFFTIENIKGEAATIDLTKLENIRELPEADLCLMFKLIDTIENEKSGHKYSEEMIKILIEKCKFLVASFATRTITGKPMNYPHRGWIERMLDRIGLNFQVLEFPNEIFYVISKS